MPPIPPNAMMGGGMTPPLGQSAITPGPTAPTPGLPPPNAMTGAQTAPAPQPPPIVTRAQIDSARKHSDAMVDGLLSLTSQPRGSLTKKKVFEGASDMISRGAFPTASSKQALISEMAEMPDDDGGIRKVLAQHLVQAVTARAQIVKLHGERV